MCRRLKAIQWKFRAIHSTHGNLVQYTVHRELSAICIYCTYTMKFSTLSLGAQIDRVVNRF